MIPDDLRWPAGLVAAAGVASAMTAAGGASLPRTLIVLGFLLLCPGLALLRLAGSFDWLATLTLSLTLSIAVDMLLALGLAYAGLWSPAAALIGLAGIVIGAAGVDAWRRGALA
jgi:uncharacterized membrane protein